LQQLLSGQQRTPSLAASSLMDTKEAKGSEEEQVSWSHQPERRLSGAKHGWSQRESRLEGKTLSLQKKKRLLQGRLL